MSENHQLKTELSARGDQVQVELKKYDSIISEQKSKLEQKQEVINSLQNQLSERENKFNADMQQLVQLNQQSQT